MKKIIVSIDALEESPEGDISQFGYEEHELQLHDDEKLLGIVFVYEGSEPLQVDLSSKP